MSLPDDALAELARIFDVPVELLQSPPAEPARPDWSLFVPIEVSPDVAAALIGDECSLYYATRSCSCWRCSPPSSESAGSPG